MKTLATLFRHVCTYLIGLLVAWLAIYLTGDDLKTATDAANALVEPLVILAGFVAVIVARLAMPIFNKFFRAGAGELDVDDHKGGSGGSLPTLFLLCGALGLIGFSSVSCTAGTFPVRIGIQGPGGAVSYSSKGGLTAEIHATK